MYFDYSFYLKLHVILVEFPVAKRPEVNPFKFSGTLSSGKRVSVNCAVIDGDPPFVFEWYKDGVPLKSGSSYVIKVLDEFNSNLAILNLGPEDNGNYTCRVSNEHGKYEQWDALFMKGTIFKYFVMVFFIKVSKILKIFYPFILFVF